MKKYREKLKNPCNAEKLQKYVVKDRENYKKYRERQISENAENFKKKRAQQTAECRKRKQLEKVKGYSTERSLKRAGKRYEKKLPDSVVKKKEIVSELSKKFLEKESEYIENCEDSMKISEKHQSIKDFYLRDDISRQMPGMKDFKSFKNALGVKEKIQLRYMMMTCEQALVVYNLENPENCSGKSVFYNLRPAYVLSASKTPHDVCSCQYHQDMYLLFDSFSRFIIEVDSMKELLIKLVCSPDSFKCMNNSCEQCADFVEPLVSLFDVNQFSSVTTLEQWNTTGIPCRIKTSQNLKEVITKFVEKFPAYKTHSYIAKVQHEFFTKCKEQIEVKSVISIL